MNRFTTRAVSSFDAAEFETYSYPPPYDLYNSSPGSAPQFLDPANGYFSVIDLQGELGRFGCTGAEARVPGGRYNAHDALVSSPPRGGFTSFFGPRNSHHCLEPARIPRPITTMFHPDSERSPPSR